MSVLDNIPTPEECTGDCHTCGGCHDKCVILVFDDDRKIFYRQYEDVLKVVEKLEIDATVRYVTDPKIAKIYYIDHYPMILVDNLAINKGMIMSQPEIEEMLLRLGY